jgi:hypothetical protein
MKKHSSNDGEDTRIEITSSRFSAAFCHAIAALNEMGDEANDNRNPSEEERKI